MLAQKKARLMRTRCTGASSLSSTKRLRLHYGQSRAKACGVSLLPIENSPTGIRTNFIPSEFSTTCSCSAPGTALQAANKTRLVSRPAAAYLFMEPITASLAALPNTG